ncbi:hypothetical protein ACT6P6_16280 [Priestia endophytica]|uniref:hypothetical protein n=1 Tax=Priestia filamentosa TaxID=1402861 RepID=UPI002E1ED327|nr:hypothetical protein [Priestia filamentosa]
MATITQNVQELNQKVKVVHTLGPAGTNCEKAGLLWLEKQKIKGEVVLHKTLEEALPYVKETENSILIGCAVYPYLHDIVFKNLSNLELIDSFIMPTYNMVLAAKEEVDFSKDTIIASHPAPANLAQAFSSNIRLVDSNAQAALDCSLGIVDSCITTIKAAEQHNLFIVKDFGEVPMCFTVHARK